MKRRVGFITMMLIAWAVFVAQNTVAQVRCKTVRVHLSDYLEDAGIDACGYLGYCGEGRLVGTFEGRLLVSGLDSDTEYPTFGNSHVWRGRATIETKQGKIFTTTTGVNYYETFSTGGVFTNVEAHAVAGGTGRYEGATGYIHMSYEFVPPEFFPATGEMAGEICWSGM